MNKKDYLFYIYYYYIVKIPLSLIKYYEEYYNKEKIYKKILIHCGSEVPTLYVDKFIKEYIYKGKEKYHLDHQKILKEYFILKNNIIYIKKGKEESSFYIRMLIDNESLFNILSDNHNKNPIIIKFEDIKYNYEEIDTKIIDYHRHPNQEKDYFSNIWKCLLKKELKEASKIRKKFIENLQKIYDKINYDQSMESHFVSLRKIIKSLDCNGVDDFKESKLEKEKKDDYFSFKLHFKNNYITNNENGNKLLFDEFNSKKKKLKKDQEYNSKDVVWRKRYSEVPYGKYPPKSMALITKPVFYQHDISIEKIKKCFKDTNKTLKKINEKNGDVCIDFAGFEGTPIEYFLGVISEFKNIRKINFHIGEDYEETLFGRFEILKAILLAKENDLKISFSHCVPLFDKDDVSDTISKIKLIELIAFVEENYRIRKNISQNIKDYLSHIGIKDYNTIYLSIKGRTKPISENNITRDGYFINLLNFIDIKPIKKDLIDLNKYLKKRIIKLLCKEQIILDINISSNINITRLKSFNKYDILNNYYLYKDIPLKIGTDIPNFTGKSIQEELIQFIYFIKQNKNVKEEEILKLIRNQK